MLLVDIYSFDFLIVRDDSILKILLFSYNQNLIYRFCIVFFLIHLPDLPIS